MCGIVILATARQPVENQALDTALGLLSHRGPDGQGQSRHWEGHLAMGHRRLAIFAPGDGGAQPMVSPSGDTIVFNGSLYNYPELRLELGRLGHRFSTDSDTEIILAAWREWREEAFSRFNGTWALALHDSASDCLVVSRDRLGVRPLYLRREPGSLAIASEIRAIVAATGMTARPDPILALDYLALGWTDHDGRTLVEGICEIPAGALWMFSRDGDLTRRRYHSWPQVESEAVTKAEAARARAEAARQLPDLLADATRLRLRAHVPIAAHLSGGLDSGAVAWAIGHQQSMMPDDLSDRFRGFFSYGYDETCDFDEIAAAIATRDHVAPTMPLHEIRAPVVPTMAEIEDFIAIQELPVPTPSPLAGLRLYRAMRKTGAIVAVTGDGSDEIFAGYTRRTLPMAFRDGVLGGSLGRAAALWRSPHLNWRDAAARLSWNLPHPALTALMHRRPHMAVLNKEFRAEYGDRMMDWAQIQTLPLTRQGPQDVEGGLLRQILRYADRNAMAAGMETRSPFLDHRIVTLAMSLPMAAKTDHSGGKLPLRDAMTPYLPPAIPRNPKARGLGHAEQFSIGRLDLGALFADPPANAGDWIDCRKLALALRRFPRNPRLWWPVCFLLWLRQVERQWA